jgi:hypothetical protein
MTLPNADAAIVPKEKLVGYLLSSAHNTGRAKAAFLRRFGFVPDAWEVLASALRQHAEAHDVASAESTVFGTRYTIEGELLSPDGRDPWMRTVWFVEEGATAPRLVTAYPTTRR